MLAPALIGIPFGPGNSTSYFGISGSAGTRNYRPWASSDSPGLFRPAGGGRHREYNGRVSWKAKRNISADQVTGPIREKELAVLKTLNGFSFSLLSGVRST